MVNNETAIFKGIVTDISLNVVNGVYHLEVYGVSGTFGLDLKPIRRSFQDTSMTCKKLVEHVLKDYAGADFIDSVSGNIGKVIVQYDETDWEFLKRMASHFNTGLVVESKSQDPKFWFGIPPGKEVTGQYNYNIGKRFHKKSFAYYEIQSYDMFDIGDKIKHNNTEFIVYAVKSTLTKGILKNQYRLATNEGIRQAFIKNQKISGVSMEGKVIDIQEDKVKVHLDIDKEQIKESAYWFPYGTFYTAEGQTGWFCTPEPGDRVKVYFPGTQEEKGLVASSVRKRVASGDKISDPDTKYFRTKYGKEKKYTKKDLSISAKDNKLLIRLNEDDGVDILSDENIKISSDTDLIIKAGNIELEAKEEFVLNCADSSIMMDGTTNFCGKYVKVRC